MSTAVYALFTMDIAQKDPSLFTPANKTRSELYTEEVARYEHEHSHARFMTAHGV